MTAYIVIREDQSEHGFVDTGVVGLFRNRKGADDFLKSCEEEARQEGLRICGEPGTEPDWDVCWVIESHSVV